MNIVGILLITVAVLAGIDVVMYLVLSVADRHWEKRFENEEDKNNESSDSLRIIARGLQGVPCERTRSVQLRYSDVFRRSP